MYLAFKNDKISSKKSIWNKNNVFRGKQKANMVPRKIVSSLKVGKMVPLMF